MLSRIARGAATLAMLSAAACATSSGNDMPDRPPHHTDDGFANNYGNAAHGFGWKLLRFLWELRTSDWEDPELARVEPDAAFLAANRTQDTLTWLGHAGFLLQLDGHNILTDPMLSRRASPVSFAGPARIQAPGLEIEQLPPIDVIVISHDHYDHLDLPTLKALRDAHDPLLVVPLRVGEWLKDQGFSHIQELDWWMHHDIDGLRVHAVPVQHFSGRGLFDRNQRLWAGYVLEAGGRRVFFGGDTGYSQDFADIGERFAPIDLGLIPIGAYEPRDFMAPVHVNPEESVRIHQDIGARRSVGMHWGTFRLTTEALDEPPRRLRRAMLDAGLVPEHFETMALGEVRRLWAQAPPQE